MPRDFIRYQMDMNYYEEWHLVDVLELYCLPCEYYKNTNPFVANYMPMSGCQSLEHKDEV